MTAGVARARLGVVVSTYEWPEALDAVLRSFCDQSDRDFTLVVADDGSSAATKSVVERWRPAFEDRLTHVWQPDEGFRLARVLNLGVLAIDADYLVLLHGESIPRRHFVRAIRSCIEPGWFVAGRRIQLRRSSRHACSMGFPCIAGAWSTGSVRGGRRRRSLPLRVVTAGRSVPVASPTSCRWIERTVTSSACRVPTSNG